MSDDLLARGRQILAAQPFSALLGAELLALAPGHAEIALPHAERLLQQHGFVHGGVLAYLADNTLTFAGGSVLGDALTAEFKINFLRPARDAERLLAVAEVVDASRRQALCRCEVFSVQGTERRLCAAAQGSIRKAE